MDTENESKNEEQAMEEEVIKNSPKDISIPTDSTVSVPDTPIADTLTLPLPMPEDPAQPADAPILLLSDTSASLMPIQRMPTIPQLAVALGALALMFALSYLPLGRGPNDDKKTQQAVEQAPENKEATADHYFEEVSITAEAAYVWDVKNQRALYNKNAGKQLPLASLTKLMTALVAYEHLDREDRIPITRGALLQEGDSNLKSGETFALQDLANFTLITSSNDGAYALAAAAGAALAAGRNNSTGAFVDAMNAKAEEIGLSQSYFTNPTGLDVNGVKSGSYGSARDMAFLMEYLTLKHPEILERTKEAASTIRNEDGTTFRAVNTNEITAHIPGLIGSKTGFTGLAGGNLVIAYDAGLNRPIVIAVLGSTRDGRFSDVTTLIEETARAIANE